MSNYETLFGSAPSAPQPGPRPPRKPRASKRKSWAIALGAAFALFIGAVVALPHPTQADLQTASSDSTAKAATATASATATATATPSSSPTVQETGAPLDPETPYLLAQGVSPRAPRAQPAFATKAIDLLASLPVKGRAPKTGYDRAMFGQAWADVGGRGP